MCVAPHQDTQYIAALIPHYTHAPELLSMNGGCGTGLMHLPANPPSFPHRVSHAGEKGRVFA